MVNLDSGCKCFQKLFRDPGTCQPDDRKFWLSVILTEKNMIGDFRRVDLFSVIHAQQLVGSSFNLIRRIIDPDRRSSAKYGGFRQKNC